MYRYARPDPKAPRSSAFASEELARAEAVRAYCKDLHGVGGDARFDRLSDRERADLWRMMQTAGWNVDPQ